ncbi:MAG: hypothetical protein JXR37_07245 [Kiritimatiellae bacterium]|nr:hypothetical protein [Kiritimatiellia bacterium]
MMRGAMGAAVCLLAALLATGLVAGPVIDDPVDWSSPPSVEGWKDTDGVASVANPAGYLQITFPAQGGPPDPQEDVIYTDGADLTGDFQTAETNLAVQFDFYAEDALPGAGSLALWMHSSGSDRTWRYSFNNTAIGVWETHAVPFDPNDANWQGEGTAEDFWTDLATIDWIGIRISTWDTQQLDFGLDNWEYFVPEPGSVYVVATALLAMAFVFRERLRALAS